MEIKINDQYWLDMGFEFIDGSIKRIKDEIQSLKKYVDTIKIPYTLLALAESVLLNFKDNWLIHLIVLSSPILIIELSKWYLNIATISDSVEINYRNPPQIERQYIQLFNNTYKKLQRAKTISLIATVTMFIALVGNATYSSAVKYKKEIEKIEKQQIYFKGDISAKDKSILLRGKFPKDTDLEIISKVTLKNDSTIFDIQHFKINKEEIFFNKYEIIKDAKEIEFFGKYTQDKETKLVAQKIKIK